MFRSLVVVLPAKHEGGSLLFRHNNKEWTFGRDSVTSRFDCSLSLIKGGGPCIVYLPLFAIV